MSYPIDLSGRVALCHRCFQRPGVRSSHGCCRARVPPWSWLAGALIA